MIVLGLNHQKWSIVMLINVKMILHADNVEAIKL